MVCISTVAEYNLLKEMGLYFLTLLSFEIDYGFYVTYCKRSYLRVGEIYTSYAECLQLRKISPRMVTKISKISSRHELGHLSLDLSMYILHTQLSATCTIQKQ